MWGVLDLCGGSGSWSQPYRDAGYDVEIVDPVVDGRDARLLQRIGGGFRGVLAAPVCTVFSYARNRYPPTDAEVLEALSLVDACVRIAWVQMRAGASWWALENPRNKLRRYLGPARLEFYQWEYGEPGHKPTCIWGDFAMPMKHAKPRAKPSTFRTQYENARPEDAITPAGFARAFFEVNP
jgi:hypothetical protein